MGSLLHNLAHHSHAKARKCVQGGSQDEVCSVKFTWLELWKAGNFGEKPEQNSGDSDFFPQRRVPASFEGEDFRARSPQGISDSLSPSIYISLGF